MNSEESSRKAAAPNEISKRTLTCLYFCVFSLFTFSSTHDKSLQMHIGENEDEYAFKNKDSFLFYQSEG